MPVFRAKASVTTIDWSAHASLFHDGGGRHAPLHLRGQLHALVAVALTMAHDLDALMIETDSGQRFCRGEIRYLGLLADRPQQS